MDIDSQRLIDAAREAAQGAYAPYSKFRVGAALLTTDGEIVTGFNIENASYGLTLCAERAALVRGLCEGRKRFVALGLCAGSAEASATPCGACRQVLAEFMGPETPVFYAGLEAGSRIFRTTLGELLPKGFRL